jgi:hypothetical protein
MTKASATDCARCGALEARVAELEAIVAFGKRSSYEKALVFRADNAAGLTGAEIAAKHHLAPTSRNYVNNCLSALEAAADVVDAWRTRQIPDKKMFELKKFNSDPATQVRLLRAHLTRKKKPGIRHD